MSVAGAVSAADGGCEGATLESACSSGVGEAAAGAGAGCSPGVGTTPGAMGSVPRRPVRLDRAALRAGGTSNESKLMTCPEPRCFGGDRSMTVATNDRRELAFGARTAPAEAAAVSRCESGGGIAMLRPALDAGDTLVTPPAAPSSSTGGGGGLAPL